LFERSVNVFSVIYLRIQGLSLNECNDVVTKSVLHSYLRHVGTHTCVTVQH